MSAYITKSEDRAVSPTPNDSTSSRTRIFADALDEDDLNVLIRAARHDQLSPGSGGIGCVVNANTSALIEPVEHIIQRQHSLPTK